MKNVLVILLLITLCSGSFAQSKLPAKFAFQSNPIELTRLARPNVYMEAVGHKAAIFGTESGVFESWVFPIKLFHDARIGIQVEGQDAAIDFSSCIERIVTRPEATTLIASNQLFTIRAHFLTPIDEQGSLILLDIETPRTLTLTISFVPDLKPMWPGGMGGQAAYWRDDLKAFIITESRRKYNGFFGSPAAIKGVATPAHQLASGSLRFDIKVDPQQARKSFYPLIIAGNTKDRQTATDLYNRLSNSIAEQYQKTFAHYRRLRETMTSIETPDQKLNLAFEWAKISLDKGMIDNPDLGYGLIAGWSATGDGARPGFGWYFGGDAAINSYAMTAYGDFESVKSTFRFLAKYQRADGKITHEISQAAGMIKWFDEYPYAYYHADTTPFYIAAIYNYYRQSGDAEFIKELWPVLKKAYQFCLDNDSDGDGILENSKAGLGASELGSLLNDLHQDIYLAATNLEASKAITELALIGGDAELAKIARDRQTKAQQSINTRYWNPSENRYAYALTKSGKQNMETTAWTAVPMMFGQFDSKRVNEVLSDLASTQISTDWGAHMLSNKSPAYDPIAYNNGGVWPFLTGFVALGEYKYGHSHSGFAHLKQIANLTFDFALGYHPEILSGDFYRPLDESVPHQLFSSGMIITPLMKGMLGVNYDPIKSRLELSPQLPAGWDRIKIKNLVLGRRRLNFEIAREGFHYKAVFEKDDQETLEISLTPVFGSPPIFLKVQDRASIEWDNKNGFEIDAPPNTPSTGDRVQALKILGINSNSDKKFSVKIEGLSGQTYHLRIRSIKQIASIDGAAIKSEKNGWVLIEVEIPAEDKNGWRVKTIEVELK